MKGISNDKKVSRLLVATLIGGLICSQSVRADFEIEVLQEALRNSVASAAEKATPALTDAVNTATDAVQNASSTVAEKVAETAEKAELDNVAKAAKKVSVAVAPKQTWGGWFSSRLTHAKDSVKGFFSSARIKVSKKGSGVQKEASKKFAELKAVDLSEVATETVKKNPKTLVFLAGVVAGFAAKAVYDSGVVGKTAKAAKKNPKNAAAIATPVVAGAGYLAWINAVALKAGAVACKAAVVANPTLAGLGAVSILGGGCLKYLWTNRKNLHAKTSNIDHALSW